jgi:uncharacterized membrane protein YraQ (UPF0718 family)
VTRNQGRLIQIVFALGFALLVAGSVLIGYEPGRQMGQTFATTAVAMLGVLPCAFVLIALFDVWVKRETVERHLGAAAGSAGYLWVALLAGVTVGGLYLAFPVAASLARKGARLSIVFAYVGLAGVCRFPMMMFEVSFLGWRFTTIRLATAVPLVIVTSWALGRALEFRGWKMSHSGADGQT